MGIVHAKHSSKYDGSDSTLVQPSDWNAEHSGHDLALHTDLGLETTTGSAAKVTAHESAYDHVQGFSGFSGYSGTNGTGTSGYSGVSGFSGTNGGAGTSGYSGYSGSTGATIGYTLHVQALTSSPGDGATVYFGQLPKAPVTSANISKVYIPKAGTIKAARIYVYSGTAGTNENWSLYIRLNNSSDTLIQTVGANTNERVFTNTSLNISVAAGDYIEIKGVQPTWATNPLTTIYGGYVYIE